MGRGGRGQYGGGTCGVGRWRGDACGWAGGLRRAWVGSRETRVGGSGGCGVRGWVGVEARVGGPGQVRVGGPHEESLEGDGDVHLVVQGRQLHELLVLVGRPSLRGLRRQWSRLPPEESVFGVSSPEAPGLGRASKSERFSFLVVLVGPSSLPDHPCPTPRRALPTSTPSVRPRSGRK